MGFEQMEMDLRLDYEKDLKSNIATVVKFTGEKMQDDLEASGRPLTKIRTKQEAYGVAAQQFVQVCGKHKMIKSNMDDFLKSLEGDGEATQIAGTLYGLAIDLANEAIIMAVHAKRILEDLYYGDQTPLEAFMNSSEPEDEEVEEYEEE